MTTKSDTTAAEALGTPSATTRRAGVYLRISEDRTGREAGVRRQEKDCRELAGRLGWDVTHVYADNDVSAFKQDNKGRAKRRPEYERMKADLRAGHVDAVVVWHPDRLYRRVRDLLDVVDLVNETHAEVATVQAGAVDLATPNGRLVAIIGAGVAAHESEHKSERTKAWHRQRAEAGQPNGGKRPFGYRPDRVTIDEAEAEVIREGARRVLAGEKRFGIVTDWNARGLPTVTGVKWSTTMLHQVLTGPRIAGFRQHNGKLHPAAWPAILDSETWAAVKAALTSQRGKPGRPASYFLSGIVRCGLCGTGMTGNVSSRRVRGYRCNTEQSHAHGCGKVARNAERVEGHVRDMVLAALDGPGLVEALRSRAARPDSDAEVLATLATLDGRLKRLKAEYSVEEMWTKAEYLEHRSELEGRISEASARLSASADERVLRRLPADLAAWWETAAAADRRDVVGLVVDHVRIHPSGKGDNHFNPDLVEVVWKA